MENLREFLLKYLENKYNASPLIKEYAEKVLLQLEKGSVCLKLTPDEVEALEKENSTAIGIFGDNRPLILHNEKLYIQRYSVYQTKVLKKIEALIENGKLHIITGGPGTGKTTSLAEILKDKLGKKILLAAPTGKAALRMKESLAQPKEWINWQGKEFDTKTLHRLLGYRHLSINFKHNAKNTLKADIVVIDECSMIDLPMMAKLLDAVPDSCDLYLLGDKNQLPSVEAGSVFADICEKYRSDDENLYIELTKSHRSKDAPGIIELSTQILEESVEKFDNENIEHRENFSIKKDWYKNLFNAKQEKAALQFLKTFQILCASKSGKNGCKRINEIFTNLAKKQNAKYTPIMITENDSLRNLFNGDVGVKDENKNVAYFENKFEEKGEGDIKQKTYIPIPVLTLPTHEPAFAITVHKSQGSEYDNVVVVYPEIEPEREFLTKELLYTAITRAKNKCLIFGNKDVLLESCKRKVERASGIV